MTTMPVDNHASYERAPVPWPAGIKGGAVLYRLSRLSPSIVGSDPAGLAVMADEALRPLQITAEDIDFIKDADCEAWDAAVAHEEMFMRALLRKSAQHADSAGPAPAFLADLDPAFAAALRITGSQDSARRLANISEELQQTRVARLPAGRGREPVRDAYFVIVRVAVWYRFEQKLPLALRWITARELDATPNSRRSNDEFAPVSDTALLICELVDAFGIDRDNVALANVAKRYLAELEREGREPRQGDSIVVERSG